MTYNNTVTIIGNTGDDAQFYTTDNNAFATFSLATTDSYKDKEGNWQNKETVWHQIMVFNPFVIKALEAYKKGTRLKVTGSISYRDFKAVLEDGTVVTKKEATIIAGKIEQAPLVKKDAA